MSTTLLAIATALSIAWQPLDDGSGHASGAEAPKVLKPAGPAGEASRMDPLGTNAFAVDLHGELKGTPGNLFYAPSSLTAALAMVYNGARGRTAAEMAKVLHYQLPPESLPAAYAEWAAGRGTPKGYRLDVANRLWGQKGHPFLPSYLERTRASFGAELSPLDFADGEGSRRVINTWVEEKTENKIRDLIPSGVLTPLTRLVLTNAVYFKGDWIIPFPKESTRPQEFYLGSGKDIQVPTMRVSGTFGYRKADGYQVLQMGYRGGDVAMVIVLPDAVEGLDAIESRLTPEHFDAGPARKAFVMLPRFKMESSFSLRTALSAMGMPTAFSDESDLSGMDGTRELYISAVLHKAFVDVNESGTEAAAATGVVVATRAMIGPEPIPFKADHPFLFAIKHLRTGELLFVGRMVKPGA